MPWESGEWTKEAAKAIHDAAIQANIPELTRLLELGADVNTPECAGDTWTPLLSVAYHFDIGPATREAYIAAARVLLEHGADVDACETGNEYRTALHLVAASDEEAQDTPSDASGHEQGLEGLRAHSPLPISPSPDYKLHFLQLLISYEADITASHGTGETALHLAIGSRSSLAVINLILTTDKNLLQAQDHRGKKAIHVAASHAHFKAAKLLLDSGAIVDEPDADGATHPLIEAAARDHASLCRFLVQHDGADVNMTEPNGCTPLHAAAMSKHGDNADTIRQLAALGADLEARIPSNGQTALHLAAATEEEFSSWGKPDSVAALLNLGATIEAVDNSGWTALHFAAQGHHLSVLELLLDRGAQVGKTVADGPN
ncbi:ankyrin repeat-containing domain protein [Cladorrhinum sp. PSN259]|nr:ankyrin repeat-containing domain protein [Cladorrhinum sp. PSN259]